MPNMEILKWRDVVDASDFQFSLLRYPCRMYGQLCCILEFCAKIPCHPFAASSCVVLLSRAKPEISK